MKKNPSNVYVTRRGTLSLEIFTNWLFKYQDFNTKSFIVKTHKNQTMYYIEFYN